MGTDKESRRGVRRIEASLVSQGARYAIVAGRWNEFFGEPLIDGAVAALKRHGAGESEIEIVIVPGSFELPMVAARCAKSGAYDAVICLGVLIRGATPHFDYIASSAASGIARASLDSGVPITFGVITCDTLDQAIERSGSKAGNKGAEAALAAVEMVNLYRALGEER